MVYAGMTTKTPVNHLCDRALLQETATLAAGERGATVELIAVLAEVDARRLYLGEGFSSLFMYCTRVLHLSEHAAYGRIEAARAARKFPQILELLAEGALTLTAATLLAPHLTSDNATQVLDAARFKTKREVEEVVAATRPQPDVVALVRKLPSRRPVLTPSLAHPADPAKKDVDSAELTVLRERSPAYEVELGPGPSWARRSESRPPEGLTLDLTDPEDPEPAGNAQDGSGAWSPAQKCRWGGRSGSWRGSWSCRGRRRQVRGRSGPRKWKTETVPR